MIESGWLHVVSSSTTLDMIGLLSSRNTTYQDLAEAAVRLLVVLVKKRKKSVLECFFSFAEAAVDAREALLCRLFFCHIWQKVMAENPRSIDKKMPTFYYTKARFARFCVAFWSTVVLLLSLSLFVLIWCKSSKQYLGLTVVYQLIVHSSRTLGKSRLKFRHRV